MHIRTGHNSKAANGHKIRLTAFKSEISCKNRRKANHSYYYIPLQKISNSEMRKPLILFFTFALSVLVLTGCYRAKKYIYFQNLKATIDTAKTTSNDSTQNSTNAIIIQPFDQLDIRIKTSAKALESLTESGSSGSALTGGSSPGSSYLAGFQVDGNGNVILPVLGSIHLNGLTIREAKSKIRDRMKTYMTDPYIDIKFLTFRVTVLGEVASPGPKAVANERANLIDILALSGDLTDMANRQKIKIIRGDPRSPKVYEIDFLNTKSFNSPGFILQPNDIIYVEPLPRKFLFANITEFNTLFTLFNTGLIVFELLYSFHVIGPSH